MNSHIHILIISESTYGLAEIMSGYLRFYSENKIKVTISGKNKVIHPLAEQVLSEDGIEFEPNNLAKIATNPDVTIFINMNTTAGKEAPTAFKNFNFRNPLQPSDYDEILTDFRTVREEIKKACIQLVGELQLV